MCQLIKYEFKKLFSRTEFYVILLVSVGLAILGLFEPMAAYQNYGINKMPSAFHTAMIYQGKIGDTILLCLIPLLASFSHADTYFIENKNSMLAVNLTRTTYFKYIVSKLIVVSFTALIFSILPFLINQCFCIIAFPGYFDTAFLASVYESTESLGKMELLPRIAAASPLVNNTIHIAFVGLFGLAYGIMTLALTLFIKKNRVVAVCSTTVISFLMFFILGSFRLEPWIPYYYMSAMPFTTRLNIQYFFITMILLFCVNFVLIGIKFITYRRQIL